MMNKPLFFTLLSALWLFGCHPDHLDLLPPLEDPSLMEKKLTIEQMHQDIGAFVTGVLERHPELDAYADMGSLKAAVKEAKAEITQPLLRTDFYRIAGRLNHHLNDGHSFLIWPYQEYKQLKEDGHTPFPFDVVISQQGAIYLKYDYQSGKQKLAAGSQILTINGVPASSLVSTLQQYSGGESRRLREQVVAKRFALSLWAVFGFIDSFELEIDNRPASLAITQVAITKDQSWQRVSADSNEQQGEHYYKQLQAGVGLLYLAHFDIEPNKFEDFIDGAFAEIKRDQIHSLIIDIRDNPGGNTDTVTYLSRYLADKPFRLVSSVQEKLNRDNRGWFNYKGEVGELITTQWQEWETPIETEQRFKGEVYLLVGPITYSAAIVLATTLKDHQFATLVGEKTGGFANQTAQGNLFNLPHSKLRAYVTTRTLIRPSGDIERRSVEPHHVVNRSVDDIKKQRDAGIARALTLIEEKQANDA
ncbi:peptidase S41 [Corallincola holothuriorum]|uniref:Peptidase S41 n=1 Tax=Corallincola holothuriorum TaxID=2282215 RepID=A0A368NQ17_9GAMM|nr:S41 family peptidase [Corallincola holothuriorum]RCU51774.1 peptidase S41 [Corallincola holothuriorum]